MEADTHSESGRNGFVKRFSHAVIAKRIWVLAVTLLLCAAAATGLMTLTFNPDSRVFLGDDNPQRMALERIEKTYTPANSVVFIVAPQSGSVFDRRILSLIQELTDEAWSIPHAFQVTSLANAQLSEVDGDEISIDDLYREPNALSDAELADIRNLALSDRENGDRSVSADGSVAAVTVLVHTPDIGTREAIVDIGTASRQLATRMEASFPQADIRLSGGIMGDMAFAEAARRDTQTLVPLMLVIVAIALAVALRTVVGMLAVLSVVSLSTIVAMGLGGHIGYSINAATSGAPVIIMTLAIADCVHLLTTISDRRRQGDATQKAIADALQINFAPIVITSLTTAIGFLSLNFSESPPLGELGTIVAIGAVAAFVLSVTFLPALVSLLPIAESRPRQDGAAAMRRLADFAINRRRQLTWFFVVTIPLLAAGIARLEINDNYIRYFDDSFAFRQDTDFMEDKLVGLHVIQFSLPSGESQGITRPDYLARMDAFADWLGSQQNIAAVHALSRSLKMINRTLNGDDPRFERLPETRELAAQLLVFLELSLPPGFDLGNTIDVDRSRALVTARLSRASSSDIRELATAGEAWLRSNAPDMATEAAGMSVAYAFVTERNIRAMLGGTLFALVMLSAVLFIYLRNARLGLISLLPNLIPASTAFGLWGYLHGEVNLAVSVVGAMTLGIVVDDTVHFLTKYVRARRDRNSSPEEAIRQTFVLVGPALIVTSVTLFLGFTVLAMSGFAVSSQAGLMSAITIVIALIADLLFLPSLLIRFAGSKP